MTKPWFLSEGKSCCCAHHTFLLGFPTGRWKTINTAPHHRLASTSLFSLSHGLPKGCVGARRHHHCMSSCCGVSRSHPKPSTSAIPARSGIPGVIVITVHVWVRRGVALVVPESLLQGLRWPWGRLHWLHRHCLCGSINPGFSLQGYVAEHQFTITTLLVDISLDNSGLHRK
jgi:hypothetical protein